MKLTKGDLTRIPFRLQIIADNIKRLNAVKILDVGCGCGDLDEAILTKLPSLEFTCVDMDHESVEDAKTRLEKFHARFIEDDFSNFDTDEKWDLCMLNGLLEHVTQPVELLKKASRLAPYVFAIVPNASSLHRIIGVELGIISDTQELTEGDLSMHHKRIYTPSLLLQHFKEASLEVVAKGGIMLKPLSDQQMSNWSSGTFNLFFNLGKKLPMHSAELWVLAKSST